MSLRSFLFSCALIATLLAATVVAQEKPDDPRWSTRTYVFKTDGAPPPAQPTVEFVPSTTPRVIHTPYEVLVVEPNIRPRPTSTYQRAELDIKAQGNNRNVMFGASHNFGGGSINVSTFITTNGGQTWTGTDIISDLNSQRGDPAPIIDKNGTFIYAHLNSSTNFGSVIGMAANYSTDRGVTWSSSIPIPGTTGDVDKELINTDDSPTSPYYGTTYMAWTLFTAGNFPATIYYSKTTNGGVSWTTAQQINTAGATTFSQGTDVAVDNNGTVYVCWNEESRTSPYISQSLGFAKSTNGGATWTFNNAVYATTGIRNNSSFNGWGVRVNDFPRIAVDKTGGGRNGWIYIVAPEINRAPAGSDADIVFHRSTDGGTTWSPGIRVNQDALNNGKSQFFPAICVDAGGGINVCYYDNRNYPSFADSCEFYMSRSLDGGNTWTDIKVSDHAFRPKSAPGVSAFMGDYVGIAAGNGKVWPMWQDDRPGNYDVWTAGIQTTENFGWVKGIVSNLSGGAPVSNVAIDFTQSVPQVQGLSNASGAYVAGARVDTPGTTVNLTMRARKFGFVDTTLNVTLTRNDSLTRNFSIRPAPGGTLQIHAYRLPNIGMKAAVTVTFNGSPVINDSTNAVTGLFSTPLPTGTYQVVVDPPSPYGTKRFASVVINAGQTTQVEAELHAVLEFNPTAVRDTLPVGGSRSKTLQLINTTTDTVAFRITDDNALARARVSKPAVQPSPNPPPAVVRPKGAPDTEHGDTPTGGGGPDAFGYRWVDSDSVGGGVTYNWVDITTVGTPVTSWTGGTDDGSFSATLPWSFPFYGNSYTNFFFTTNGWLGFNSPSTEYSNTAIPSTAVPNNAIYVWWDDLQVTGTSGPATVYYYNDVANSRYIIQYYNIRHLSATTDTLNFEVILKPNGEILMQYNRMVATPTNITSATIGIENANGTVGLQVVYNAAYMHNNLAIKFYLPDAPWISENPTVGRINPGATQNVSVTFDATGLTAGTTYNANIFVDATHPDVSGAFSVPASLRVQTATGPLIALNKTAITYPPTPLGQNRRDSVTARNVGDATLNITSITSNNPRYVVTPASGTVNPGDSLKIRITYTPTVAGTDTGRIIILSNSQGTTRRDITLSGSGYGVALIVAKPDSFVVTRPRGTDTTRVTLRIRNSGTDTLRYRIDELAGYASSASIGRSTTQQETYELAKGEVDTHKGEPPLTDGSGGPDAFGYVWIDSDEPGGPAYNWFDIKTVGTQITTWTGTPDDGYAPVTLPFSFPFYGTTYTAANIATNGYISFVTGYTTYINTAIPTTTTPNNAIYGFWDDMNFTEVGGTAWYYFDAANQRFIVQFDSVSHYLGGTETGRYSFQMVLKQNGDIVCYYRRMEGTITSATIGIENATGTVALQTVFNANYMHDNLALLFTADAVPWLSTNRTEGTIVPADSQLVEVRLHPGTALPGGTYLATLRVTGNTPDTAKVRVRMTVTTDVQQTAYAIPTTFELGQNYPNPFNPTTTIRFGLPEQSRVSLKVYNLLGQEVATLAEGDMPAAYHTVVWNGRNKAGNQVASGIYFYRLDATGASSGKFTNLKKLIFLK
jgi:hypothetical protein